MKKILLNLIASLLLVLLCCFIFVFIMVGGGTLVNSGKLSQFEMGLFNAFLLIVPGSILVSIALMWIRSSMEQGWAHFKWLLLPLPFLAVSSLYYLYLNLVG